MSEASRNPYGVKVGQIWQDWDTRIRAAQQRFVRIAAVKDGYAVTTGPPRTRIKLTRFRPTSTGYKLVQDVP